MKSNYIVPYWYRLLVAHDKSHSAVVKLIPQTLWLVYIYIKSSHIYFNGNYYGLMYSDSTGAGRSGDRLPVVVRYPAPVHTGRTAHSEFCMIGNGVIAGGREAGAYS